MKALLSAPLRHESGLTRACGSVTIHLSNSYCSSRELSDDEKSARMVEVGAAIRVSWTPESSELTSLSKLEVTLVLRSQEAASLLGSRTDSQVPALQEP